MNKYSRYALIILASVIAIAVFYLLFWVGKGVCFQKQYNSFEQIRNISSIIFGVCGAWLAITYPKAVASIQINPKPAEKTNDPDLKIASQDVNILLGFVTSMIISIIIIAICLFLPFAKEIAVKCPWFLSHKSNLLGFLFCLLGGVTVLQLYLLGSTLKNSYLALLELKRVAAKALTQQEQKKKKEY